MKNAKYLERIVKGYANHYRIRTLALLEQQPNLSLRDIADWLNTDIKNTSQHLARMTAAGLVSKKHKGAAVLHRLTRRGIAVLKFLRTVR